MSAGEPRNDPRHEYGPLVGAFVERAPNWAGPHVVMTPVEVPPNPRVPILREILALEEEMLSRMHAPDCTLDEIARQEIVICRVRLELIAEGETP